MIRLWSSGNPFISCYRKSAREPMFKYLVVVTATVEESLVTLEVESVN